VVFVRASKAESKPVIGWDLMEEKKMRIVGKLQGSLKRLM
jgi:hypothetical protein